MKTFIKTSAILGAFLFALPALAATTASLAPTSASVVAGQKFTVVITVNPNGVANYAEKIELNYPADILEATSFTADSKWMALNQPGYDSTDNVKGVMIKTAGYPGGFSSSAPFGTVSFTAKKAGKGVITIGSGSLAFEAEKQIAITGVGASITVTAPVTAPKPKTPPAKAPVAEKKAAPTAEEAKQPAEAVSPETAAPSLDGAQAAAVALPQEGGLSVSWIIGIIVLIALVAFGAYTLGKRKN